MSEEEPSVAPKQWCVELTDAARQKLEAKGFKVWCSFGSDGEPEIIASWPESKAAHCRLTLGEEDDGTRFGFYSMCYQGIGGIGDWTINRAVDAKIIDSFVFDCHAWRAIVSAIRAEVRP